MSVAVYLNGYQTYKLWMGINLHFSEGKYDIFRMKGRVNCPPNKFEERHDKSFFYRLGEDYLKGDLADFLMANIMHGRSHVSEYSDVVYREWKSKMHRIDYIFEEDCKKLQFIAAKNNVPFNALFKSVTGGIPIVLQLLNGGHIHLETVCIIDRILDGGITMRFDEQIKDKFIWPKLRNRIVKYIPWLKLDFKSLKKILIKYK